jgi:DNA repair ATPase RecN
MNKNILRISTVVVFAFAGAYHAECAFSFGDAAKSTYNSAKTTASALNQLTGNVKAGSMGAAIGDKISGLRTGVSGLNTNIRDLVGTAEQAIKTAKEAKESFSKVKAEVNELIPQTSKIGSSVRNSADAAAARAFALTEDLDKLRKRKVELANAVREVSELIGIREKELQIAEEEQKKLLRAESNLRSMAKSVSVSANKTIANNLVGKPTMHVYSAGASNPSSRIAYSKAQLQAANSSRR